MNGTRNRSIGVAACMLCLLLSSLVVGVYLVRPGENDVPAEGILSQASSPHVEAPKSLSRPRKTIAAVDSVRAEDADSTVSGPSSGTPVQLSERVESYLKSPIPCCTRCCVLERLRAEDLPELYEALDLGVYVEKRYSILFAVCLLDEPMDALKAVTKYIESCEDYRAYPAEYYEHGRNLFPFSKVVVVRLISYLPPDIGSEYLVKAFSESGAREILKDWFEQNLPASHTLDFYKKCLRQYAARGLAMLGDPVAFRCVEEEYERIKTIPEKEWSPSDLSSLDSCIDALALRDVVAERGIDEALLYSEGGDLSESIANMFPYLERYSVGSGTW